MPTVRDTRVSFASRSTVPPVTFGLQRGYVCRRNIAPPESLVGKSHQDVATDSISADLSVFRVKVQHEGRNPGIHPVTPPILALQTEVDGVLNLGGVGNHRQELIAR